MYPCQIYKLIAYALKKTTSHRMKEAYSILVLSVKEKMLKAILKDGIIGQVESQTHEPRLAQDFK